MLHLVHGRMWRVNWVVTGFAVEDFDGALLLDGTKGPSRAWVYHSSSYPQSDVADLNVPRLSLGSVPGRVLLSSHVQLFLNKTSSSSLASRLAGQ